jgi:hypothetical protein
MYNLNQEPRMAFTFTSQFAPEIEDRMRGFYQTLSEKDQRRYAALEARRLGRGGIEYIARVVGCSRRTIERGLVEVETLPHDPAEGRVRRPGGGRKKKLKASLNSSRT